MFHCYLKINRFHYCWETKVKREKIYAEHITAPAKVQSKTQVIRVEITYFMKYNQQTPSKLTLYAFSTSHHGIQRAHPCCVFHCEIASHTKMLKNMFNFKTYQ